MIETFYIAIIPVLAFLILVIVIERKDTMISDLFNVNTYMIEKIDNDCYDLYVSDDDGYTWEYYYTYASYEQAQDDAELALARANREDFYTL
jgi:uncharacterized protein YbcC (UPF0753/DUF2309 family)